MKGKECFFYGKHHFTMPHPQFLAPPSPVLISNGCQNIYFLNAHIPRPFGQHNRTQISPGSACGMPL